MYVARQSLKMTYAQPEGPPLPEPLAQNIGPNGQRIIVMRPVVERQQAVIIPPVIDLNRRQSRFRLQRNT